MQKIKKIDLERIIKEEFGKMMGGESEDSVEIEGAESELKTDLEYIATCAANTLKKLDDEEPEAWVKSHVLAAKELLNHVEEYFGDGVPDSVEHEEENQEEEHDENKEPAMKEDIDQDVNKKEVDFLTAKDKQIQNTIKKKKMGAVSPMEESEEYTDETGDTWNDEGEKVSPVGHGSIKSRGNFRRGYKDTFNRHGERGGENLDWMRKGVEDIDEIGASRIYKLEQQIRDSGEYIALLRKGWSHADAMDMLMAKYGGNDYINQNDMELAIDGIQENPACESCGKLEGCNCQQEEKVKKSDVEQLREIAKALHAKGEHGKVLDMIKRLEKGKKKKTNVAESTSAKQERITKLRMAVKQAHSTFDKNTDKSQHDKLANAWHTANKKLDDYMDAREK